MPHVDKTSIISHSCLKCVHIMSPVAHSSPPLCMEHPFPPTSSSRLDSSFIIFTITTFLLFCLIFFPPKLSHLWPPSHQSHKIPSRHSHISSPHLSLFILPHFHFASLLLQAPHSFLADAFVPWSCVTLPWSLSARLAFLIFILYCWFTYQNHCSSPTSLTLPHLILLLIVFSFPLPKGMALQGWVFEVLTFPLIWFWLSVRARVGV